MSSNQWREKAGGFFSSSSVKLKQATAVAGDVAKTAGSSVADAAERAGSVVRSRWSLLQQQQSKDGGPTMQERWRTTSTTIKKNLLETKEKVAVGLQDTKEKVVVGISETKEKVAVGRVKVEEIAKLATERSKILLANMDWWQKGSHEEAVFGVSLEVLVERQNSGRPIPQIVIRCVDYLVKSGLHAEYMFKQEPDQPVLDRLVNLYHTDWNATLPEGVSPVDVAALLKLYLSMLPEPLLTFELYDDVVDARGSDRLLRQYLCTLPAANYSTLECLTALLLRISQKSALNKMDAHSLAIELSPLLLWRRSKVAPLELQTGQEAKPTAGARSLRRFSSVKTFRKGGDDTGVKDSVLKPTSVSIRVNVQGDSNKEWSTLQGILISAPYLNNQVGVLQETQSSIACRLKGLLDAGGGVLNAGTEDEKSADMSAQIPLDDEPTSLDFAVVEAVQCLVEHHDVVFADAIEAVWQELDR